MSDNSESSEKSHEPSQRKLEKARNKGEIPRITDLQVSLGYLGIFLFCLSIGASSLLQFAQNAIGFIEYGRIEGVEIMDGGMQNLIFGLVFQCVYSVALIFFLPLLTITLGLVSTRSIVFVPDKIKLRRSRISILGNLKNKFGRQGLFEFGKSFAKLSIYFCFLGFFLKLNSDNIIESVYTSARLDISKLFDLSVQFLGVVFFISLCIGLLDFMWQRNDHMRKNRMTQKEVQDEFKESEGDPYFKSFRRNRAQEISQNRMLSDVASADVVVVNPTHYSVALKWNKEIDHAPICVAKGVDNMASKIRSLATENNIPILQDAPTARALYATLEVGEIVTPNHYEPVAAAIRYAEKIHSKTKGRAVFD